MNLLLSVVYDRSLVSLFVMWPSNFPHMFVEEIILSPLYVLSSFAEKYLIVCVGLFLRSLFIYIYLIYTQSFYFYVFM